MLQDSSPLLSTVATHLSKLRLLGLKVGMSICQYARIRLQVILATGLTPPLRCAAVRVALRYSAPNRYVIRPRPRNTESITGD